MSIPRLLSVPALIALGLPVIGVEQFDVDTVHSTAMFTINHFGISNFIGRFDEVSGKITWDEANAAECKVVYHVKTDSLDTNNKKRDQDVKGPDFMNTKEFPEITFESSSVKKDGEKYIVEGKLTMHGVTKPQTVEVTKTGEGKDPMGKHRIGFWTTFSVKRSEFGLTAMPAPMLGDEINLTLSTEGTLAAP